MLRPVLLVELRTVRVYSELYRLLTAPVLLLVPFLGSLSAILLVGSYLLENIPATGIRLVWIGMPWCMVSVYLLCIAFLNLFLRM